MIFLRKKKKQNCCDRCGNTFEKGDDKQVCFVYKDEYLFCATCNREVAEQAREYLKHYCPMELWEELCKPCQMTMRDHLEQRRKWFTENRA